MIDAVTAIFVLSFCGAVFALLVAVAKWQQEKDRRWDEISRAVSVENDLRLCSEFYWREETKNHALGNQYNLLRIERDELQNKLSAILCPSNNHVWKDGRCTKCGRARNE